MTMEELEEHIPELNMGAKYTHQILIHRISTQLSIQLNPLGCEVVGGTYLFLEISPEEYLENPVKILNTKDNYEEPDLMVLCESSNIQILEDRVFGVPRFIIEVLSVSTSTEDTLYKRHRYQRCGVEEYWIIDPKRKEVFKFLLSENYKGILYRENPAEIPLSIFNANQW